MGPVALNIKDLLVVPISVSWHPLRPPALLPQPKRKCIKECAKNRTDRTLIKIDYLTKRVDTIAITFVYMETHSKLVVSRDAESFNFLPGCQLVQSFCWIFFSIKSGVVGCFKTFVAPLLHKYIFSLQSSFIFKGQLIAIKVLARSKNITPKVFKSFAKLQSPVSGATVIFSVSFWHV